MASRPAFAYLGGKVCSRSFEFEWNPGLAPSQKKKNVAALHAAIGAPALEISTKSESELGRSLSAFNLTLDGRPLECVYHSGKITTAGGPYADLLDKSPREAKHDPRLAHPIIGFMYEGWRWPAIPISAFYDYLWIKAAMELSPDLSGYTWFTDIEYNPNKSKSTQARSAAILKAVYDNDGVMDSPESFIEFHKKTVIG